MIKFSSLTVLPLTAIGLIGTCFLGSAAHAGVAEIGEKGASVYCFMRNSGNDHSVSWDAAYQIIKRQKSSLFKTSPKHAGVMITETVVSNPEKYPQCGKYLGDIFSPKDINLVKEEFPEDDFEKEVNQVRSEADVKQNSSDPKKGDRYSY